jgi:eukaryotic-like serine/threonine-protein kinase
VALDAFFFLDPQVKMNDPSDDSSLSKQPNKSTTSDFSAVDSTMNLDAMPSSVSTDEDEDTIDVSELSPSASESDDEDTIDVSELGSSGSAAVDEDTIDIEDLMSSGVKPGEGSNLDQTLNLEAVPSSGGQGLYDKTLNLDQMPEGPLEDDGITASEPLEFDLSEIADRYKVLSVIGEGGMGKIFRAEQIQLGREVAIKVMKSPDDNDSIQRFIIESSITAKLDHPNIVKIFDFGRLETGAMFLVMELIDGVSLREYITQNGPLDVETGLSIATQIAGAMSEAHGHKIVHRDIKPANVLILKKAGIGLMAKVIDFGLVKNLSQNANISSTGMILGSPMYMAPEQITSQIVDDRTDIYSIGLTLYFALTGRSPYDGTGLLAIMNAQINSMPIPVESLSPQLTGCPGLASAIQIAIQKDPDNRFQNAEQMLDALRFIQRNLSSGESLRLKVAEGVLHCEHHSDILEGQQVSPLIQGKKPVPNIDVGPRETSNRMEAPPPSESTQGKSLLPTAIVIGLLVVAGIGGFLSMDEDAPATAPEVVQSAKQLITLETVPSGAEVYKGQKLVGSTPYKTKLKEDEYVSVEIRLKGYESKQIELTAETPNTKLTLAPVEIAAPVPAQAPPKPEASRSIPAAKAKPKAPAKKTKPAPKAEEQDDYKGWDD